MNADLSMCIGVPGSAHMAFMATIKKIHDDVCNAWLTDNNGYFFRGYNNGNLGV